MQYPTDENRALANVALIRNSKEITKNIKNDANRYMARKVFDPLIPELERQREIIESYGINGTWIGPLLKYLGVQDDTVSQT